MSEEERAFRDSIAQKLEMFLDRQKDQDIPIMDWVYDFAEFLLTRD